MAEGSAGITLPTPAMAIQDPGPPFKEHLKFHKEH